MPAHGQRPGTSGGRIHSPRLHVVMYSMLLVATPFVLLQSYLQEAIGWCSRYSVTVAGRGIPVVPLLAGLALAVTLVVQRSRLTRMRLLAGLVVLALIALAQQIADYYFDHRFYDLQQNWHYIAYGLFAFMVYRDLGPRGTPLHRIILVTFGAAVVFSTFDEAFQKLVSNRVYDMGDIAKDAFGAVLGMWLLYLGENPHGALLARWTPIRHRVPSRYVSHAPSLLLLLTLLSLLFLVFGSLLSDAAYSGLVVVFTLVAFACVFALVHLSQYRWGGRVIAVLCVAGVLAQAGALARHRSDGIVHQRPGFIVYKGVPIWFFDLLIFPDGSFRPVDKKEFFFERDRLFLLNQEPDIIVIGSGTRGTGGRGFPLPDASQFIFDARRERGVQVIIRPTREACLLFNRLKQERKHVLCVLHNTGA